MLFLSYARTDIEITDQLFLDLQHAKRDPWRDLEVAGGQRWWNEILEQIRSCDVFPFLLSSDSIRSRSCRAELEYAVKLGRPIVPVRIGDVSIDMAPDPIGETTVVDVRDRSPESTIALLMAIDEAPRAGPLPQPLPDPPEVPLTELGPVRDRIAEPSLSLDDQRELLVQLLAFADHVEHQAMVADLVEQWLGRADLAEGVRADLGRLRSRLAGSVNAANGADATERIAQRADRVRSVVTYLRRSRRFWDTA